MPVAEKLVYRPFLAITDAQSLKRGNAKSVYGGLSPQFVIALAMGVLTGRTANKVAVAYTRCRRDVVVQLPIVIVVLLALRWGIITAWLS